MDGGGNVDGLFFKPCPSPLAHVPRHLPFRALLDEFWGVARAPDV